MWIARDKDGELFGFRNKPLRNIEVEIFELGVDDEDDVEWSTYLDENLIKIPFEVTWENSPIEVEIEIKRKEKC